VEDAMAVDGEFNVNGQYRNSFNEEEMEDDILSRRLTSEDFVKRVPFSREDIPWGALTELEEMVVRSRVFEGLTFREIAENNPKNGSIKTRKEDIRRAFSRAIDKLRKAGLEIRKDLLDKN
jgi:DNA-directed RNA polymerase specialized sigma24 family protein